jgi:hypothetical protein
MAQEQQTAAYWTLEQEIDAFIAASPDRYDAKYELEKARLAELAKAGFDERELDSKAKVLVRAEFFLEHMADGSPKPKGRQKGALSRTYLDVLRALLSHSGDTRPSYDEISEEAICSTTTVGTALKALKSIGLSWENLREVGREARP